MDGQLGEDLTDTVALTALVHDELVALRGQLGKLTIQKFSGYPALRRICGGGDLLDAFLMFQREMTRYEGTSRDEAAAAISITAPADTVLDRLEHAVGALPQDGRLRDQRTARRWSDAGLATIAREMVYLAELQGRLGTELLGIEARGTESTGLEVIIDQMTTNNLPERAPLVRLWRYDSDGDPEEQATTLDLDLENYGDRAASGEQYTMHRHRLCVELPSLPISEGETKLLTVSIEGRDAPMRTVSLEDHCAFNGRIAVRFAVYRTIATVELIVYPQA